MGFFCFLFNALCKNCLSWQHFYDTIHDFLTVNLNYFPLPLCPFTFAKTL